jgi:catechol 2,3-dioxygenase-like lactoylglutathione lyase family enzyme
MFKPKASFSGFSVSDQDQAKKFYTETLGLKLTSETMGLQFDLPGGGQVFAYAKDDHVPATFTILNFVVEDIDEAVAELSGRGVKFEHYDNIPGMDEKGVARGLANNMGPDIAWFKDPAGNILAVLQDS